MSTAAPTLEVKKNWFSRVPSPITLHLPWGSFPTGIVVDLGTPFLAFHKFKRTWVSQPLILLSLSQVKAMLLKTTTYGTFGVVFLSFLPYPKSTWPF